MCSAYAIQSSSQTRLGNLIAGGVVLLVLRFDMLLLFTIFAIFKYEQQFGMYTINMYPIFETRLYLRTKVE